MTREERSGEAITDEVDVLQRVTDELARIQARIGPRFRRAEARSRAGRFLHGLLAPKWVATGRRVGRTRPPCHPAALERSGLGRRGGPR
jgi:hypothetical protein